MHIQQPPKLIVAHMPNVPRLTMSALPVVFTPTYITGGPMQFLQTTFDSVVAGHPVPPGGASPPSRYKPHDAIYAAAQYLCDSGARDGKDFTGAIFAYNHADWYVKTVLTTANYTATPLPTVAAATRPPPRHPLP
jgi:hypothetical protein